VKRLPKNIAPSLCDHVLRKETKEVLQDPITKIPRATFKVHTHNRYQKWISLKDSDGRKGIRSPRKARALISFTLTTFEFHFVLFLSIFCREKWLLHKILESLVMIVLFLLIQSMISVCVHSFHTRFHFYRHVRFLVTSLLFSVSDLLITLLQHDSCPVTWVVLLE
jgi:hypothetical protein